MKDTDTCDVCGNKGSNLTSEFGNLHGKYGHHFICLSCWYKRYYADPFADDPWADIPYYKNKKPKE